MDEACSIEALANCGSAHGDLASSSVPSCKIKVNLEVNGARRMPLKRCSLASREAWQIGDYKARLFCVPVHVLAF